MLPTLILGEKGEMVLLAVLEGFAGIVSEEMITWLMSALSELLMKTGTPQGA